MHDAGHLNNQHMMQSIVTQMHQLSLSVFDGTLGYFAAAISLFGKLPTSTCPAGASDGVIARTPTPTIPERGVAKTPFFAEKCNVSRFSEWGM